MTERDKPANRFKKTHDEAQLIERNITSITDDPVKPKITGLTKDQQIINTYLWLLKNEDEHTAKIVRDAHLNMYNPEPNPNHFVVGYNAIQNEIRKDYAAAILKGIVT